MVQSDRGTTSPVRNYYERRLAQREDMLSVWINEFDIETDLMSILAVYQQYYFNTN